MVAVVLGGTCGQATAVVAALLLPLVHHHQQGLLAWCLFLCPTLHQRQEGSATAMVKPTTVSLGCWTGLSADRVC